MNKKTRAIEILKLLKQHGYDLQDVIDMLCQYEEKTEPKEETSLEVRVSQLLIELGMPTSLSGYHYCKTAIITMYNHINKQEECLIVKDIYLLIAKKWNTTVSRVERAIRHAIEVCFERGNTEKLNQYFGNILSEKKEKATNSEFISTLTEVIKMKEKES